MPKGKRYKTLYLPALTIVAIVLCLLIVIAVSTYRNISRERGRTEDFLLREGLAILRAIEAGVRAENSSTQPGISHLQKLIEGISLEPGIANILLFDAEGNVVASGPPSSEVGKVSDARALAFIAKEKGFVTRYREVPGPERTFEIIKPFSLLSSIGPTSFPPGSRTEPQENPLVQWAKDKMITINLRLGVFEKAGQEDVHHAFLMGAILIVLGTGAFYFIFIVQNFYLVDRTLAQMRTYTENVVESMADGLISIDNEKNIVTLNRRAAGFLGAREKDLRGKGISSVLGKDVEALLKDRTLMIRGRDLEVPRSSGGTIPLSLSVTPLKDENDREMGSVLILRDLREIRDLQERVRRSERLASLGRLAAGVAHEIRNPLSSIRGFAQYFQQRLKGQEKEQEYAAIMIKEVDRLNRVITELLDFARPKEPHRESHRLEELLGHSLKLLEPELIKRNVKVEKHVDPNLPPAMVDRDQLSQAFLNLLLNSLESMENGGKIEIALTNVPPKLQISIRDTGRGIPAEDVGKVFDPFFSTKRRGTGLGLSIVYQIVEIHGGDIQVESREGMGTTFRVTLPVNEKEMGEVRDE
jgi:two-component system, NtrC family, sensor histidine kinase HydH